ncbi:MAG: response regulator transcription factor [Candidatus Melainabacteria bacterium]|nr:response regulator transcription factor [Candidatus Melainabacteria bacterium]
MNVLIAEDSRLTRISLKTTIQQASDRLALVGEAEDGAQAVSLAKTHRPQVVLMDIGMPVLDGIEATRQIRAECGSDVVVIMLTSHESEDDILDAFRSGANSYCLKDTTPEQLVEVILTSAAGGCYIDPRIARVVLSRMSHPLTTVVTQDASNTPATLSLPLEVPLTEREIEVLRLVSEGKNNHDIAESLCISLNTVKTHLKNIFQKLEVEDRTAAALKAIKEHLV